MKARPSRDEGKNVLNILGNQATEELPGENILGRSS
jgi:hypothetical protein